MRFDSRPISLRRLICGALYAELRRLDSEGLTRPIREERLGRRPARTVYEITDEGRLELVVQRDAALEVIFAGADPLSVVLLFARRRRGTGGPARGPPAPGGRAARGDVRGA
jgi:DNA-binding PadR family transcriptional regulator